MLTPSRFPHRGGGPAPATDLLGKAARRHSGSLHCRRAARRARQVRGPRPHSRPHSRAARPRDGNADCPSDAGRLCLGLSRSAGEPPFTMRKEGLDQM